MSLIFSRDGFGSAESRSHKQQQEVRCIRFRAPSISRTTSSWLRTTGSFLGASNDQIVIAMSRRLKVFL